MKSQASKLAPALVIALAMALPIGAQGAVLHSQTAPPGFYSDNSEKYDPPSDPYDAQLADDFTVPPGQSWTIKQVDVLGEDDPYLGMSPPPFVNVFLYAADGTLPGAMRFHESHVGVSGYPNDSVPLFGAPALGPGTYWISVQEQGGGFMVPSWYWKTVSVQDGNPAVFQNPNGGWGNGCTSWKPVGTCFAGNDSPDLAWMISGTASSLPVTLGQLQRLRNGTARLPITIPGPGTLTLGGQGVKGSSAQVAARKAATTVTLRIAASGKARKKLKAKGKATVTPAVTYTAAGADPATSTLKVKLRRR